MSNPGNYTMNQLAPDSDLDIRIDHRRKLASKALDRLLADFRKRKLKQVSVGHLYRSFDREYTDLIYSLLSEAHFDGKVKFDPDRPAPNRVELV